MARSTGRTSGLGWTPSTTARRTLAAIEVPSLLMFADNEGEVRVEHIHAMHRALPRAQLTIVPGTGHGLLADKPDLCNRMIVDFLREVSAGAI